MKVVCRMHVPSLIAAFLLPQALLLLVWALTWLLH
jgi:hypothetical protein